MATILQIANTDGNISLFTRGLKVSGLEDRLNESGPFTLLIPVNLAFRNFAGNIEDWFLPANKQKLTDMLSRHIILGKNMVHSFTNGRKLKTISGKEILVNVTNGSISLSEARVLSKDRQGKNGVVHSIDTVLGA